MGHQATLSAFFLPACGKLGGKSFAVAPAQQGGI
jgi:hypothetical protein